MNTKLSLMFLLTVPIILAIILTGCRGTTNGNQRPSDIDSNFTTTNDQWIMMEHFDRMDRLDRFHHGYSKVEDGKKLENTLEKNSVLHPGQYMISNNKQYILDFKDTGSLQLIRLKDKKVLWEATTKDEPGGVLVFHDDGNLVLYSRSHRPMWMTDTVGIGANKFMITDAGFLVIYSNKKLVWSHNKQGWKNAHSK